MVAMPLRIRPAIILFGDSITQQGFGWEGSTGWASLLSADYSRRADVLNRGFSGYNTRHALDLLPHVIGTTRPAEGVLFATVFFGANDAALPGELQHVPIDEYEQNLKTIVHHMKSAFSSNDHTCDDHGNNSGGDDNVSPSSSCDDHEQRPVPPIILFTPPPVDVDAWYKARGPPPEEKQKNDRANENAKEYGNRVKEVATSLDCPVLDVFELLGGNDGSENYGKYLRDGLHLSSSGNQLVYEGLTNLISTSYRHLAPMTDGQGKYGTIGVPLEENLWSELV
mmetsp:Transcript_23398/g.32787  ORF Transcript_23398/g.32787 Transcript_23398/m.32787 type:complete len:282 (-) Transcript_23398:192-1037(-)